MQQSASEAESSSAAEEIPCILRYRVHSWLIVLKSEIQNAKFG
jgi:hypothetical protein